MIFEDGKTFSAYVRSKLHSDYITIMCLMSLNILIVTGGAHGGPPVCDVCVGAVGAGPCGMLSAGPEG